MIVNLYGFQKKKNSTKRPSGAATQLSDVNLKDDTSVLNPVLLINQNSPGMPIPFDPSYFTYAQIPKFSRYYFITDARYVGGLWELYLTIDVLASFKTAIGNMSAYVERSAAAYNGHIIDNLYPAKTDVQITSATVSNTWSGVAPSGGCYILGVINNQSSGHVGAITYYAMSSSGLNLLLAFMFSNNIYQASTITEVGEDLFKSLFNPFQYIVSCMWFPGDPSHYGDTQVTIKLGYWDTPVIAYINKTLAEIRYISGTIPDHPQASSRGAYLNYAPYTRITLFCPPFGETVLDPTFTRAGKYLYAKVIVDPITGMATMRAAFSNQSSGSYSGKPCIEKSGMFGVPIQLAQVLSDYSGAINTAAAGLTSGSIAGLIGGAIGATVQSAIATQSPKVSTSGSNGSFGNFALEPNLVVEHTLLVDEDNADLGRPLMEKRQIGTLPGYIKCAEAHFDGSCFDMERDSINSFLLSGFFYE